MSNAGGKTAAQRKAEAQRRQYERFPMSDRDLTAVFEQPGGTVSSITVKGDDLSAGGICLKSRGFVHPQVRCAMSVLDLTGRKIRITGFVKWCVLAGGGQHKIGVQFDEKIDPRRFIDPSVVTASLEKTDQEDQQVLSGTVMVVDDQELDRELATMHLSELGITVLTAVNGQDALDKFKDQPIDILLTDVNLGDEMGGAGLVEALRSQGFLGEVIVMSGEPPRPGDDPIEKIRPTAMLEKPYRPGDLLTALNACMGRIEQPTSDSPIYSNLEHILSLSKPVQTFIDSAKSKAEEMMKAVGESDMDTARSAIRVLHSNGEGFGFPDVSKAARTAMRALDATMSLEESADSIRRLEKIVGRLQLRPKQKSQMRY